MSPSTTTEPPLRVLLVPATYHPKVGGVEEATRQLARELRRRGHTVAVVTTRWGGLPRRAEVDGVDVRRLALVLPGAELRSRAKFVLRAPAVAASLLRCVRGFDADVVHVFAAGPVVAYLAALRPLLGTRLVLTSQGELGIASDRIFHRSRALRWGLRRMLVEADAVTACSQFVLDELRAEFQFEVNERAHVMPNGVDPAELDVPPADEGRYLLAAGRLVSQKGFDVLLHAVARAGAGLAGLQVLVAGTGREGPHLERLTSELRLEDRVRWLGVVSRERLAALLQGAETVVVPSRREPFGIFLLESMAAGRAVVATRVGGIPEFAHDEETALLVPPDDPDALAAALVRVTRDPALRARLGEAARKEALHYTWRRIGDRYEAVYRRVNDERAGRAAVPAPLHVRPPAG